MPFTSFSLPLWDKGGSYFTPTGGRVRTLGLSMVHTQQHHHQTQSSSEIFKEQNRFTIKYGEMEIRLGSYKKNGTETHKIGPSSCGPL